MVNGPADLWPDLWTFMIPLDPWVRAEYKQEPNFAIVVFADVLALKGFLLLPANDCVYCWPDQWIPHTENVHPNHYRHYCPVGSLIAMQILDIVL